MIGGSGGGGVGAGAFGGGGALLIAAAGTVRIDGRIFAKGGGLSSDLPAGSGGAVKIIANQVLGGGEINCLYDGRIRLETLSLSPTLGTFPETIAVAPLVPPSIWPPANAPKARIASVNAVNSPADPTAPLSTSADIAIQENGAVNIVVETRDFPIEGVVDVRITPKFGGFTMLRAAYASGNQTLATWNVTTILSKGFTTLQARATAP